MRLFPRFYFLSFWVIQFIAGTLHSISAQTIEEQITNKINQIEILISEAEGEGIDAQKEKMTLRTAEEFVEYANWDENNVNINKSYFELVPGDYTENAQQYAEELPALIRSNIVIMLDEAIAKLNLLIEGEITRSPIPDIDWTQVTHEGNKLQYNGRPVFLADYTWKPQIPELTEFYGNQDGYNLTPDRVQNDQGDIMPWLISDLEAKPNGTIGYIFFVNKTVPQWAEDKYGPGFRMREDTYIGYDIDNPGAREMMQYLIEGTVPLMAGKKYRELGYMLVNEPHFYTTKDAWATGPVSEFTKEKFRTWLSNKHESINDLNQLWGTSFADFKDVTIEIPIDANLQGTPKWYDWVIFNNYRVTEWYKWKKAEIQKHDSEAKVHLKIMPNLWSDNQRNHGIDFEALTELSGISGNDAGAENSYLWDGPKDWEEHYSWDWREMCMSYDFLKSVSPDNIIYNTETHFLSKVPFRDLYMNPAYARTTFWMAHMQGLNANTIWVWARNEDGSIDNRIGRGYPGTLNQQPRIVNEIHSTMMDLNSHAEEITAFQEQEKPIRIFYSETSATNKANHMDDVFELYESLFFEGLPLGFATKNILNNQSHANWEVVLVHKTQYVTLEELEALQTYLNNGGTVIIDNVSLSSNEYGNSLPALNQGTGELIQVNSTDKIREEALSKMDQKGRLPEIEITETNTGGHKGCVWRAIRNQDGNIVLSVVNLGKTDASLKIELKNSETVSVWKDLLRGIPVTKSPVLKPYDVYFVEITELNINNDIFGFEIPAEKDGGAYGWWAQHPQWSRSEEQAANGSASMRFGTADYESAPNAMTLQGAKAESEMSVPAGSYHMSLKVWVDPTTTLTSVRTMVYPWRVITWDISDVNKGEWVTLSQELDFLEDLDDMRIQINKADQQEGITGPQLLCIDDISFVPPAPTITSISPSNNEQDVPVTSDIVIAFSEPMNRKSVEDAIIITPAQTNKEFTWINNAAVSVKGSNLEVYTQYTVAITDTATNYTGQRLVEGAEISFTTAIINNDIFGFEIPAEKDGGAYGWWAQHPQWSRSEEQAANGSVSMRFGTADYESAPNAMTLQGAKAESEMLVPAGSYHMSLKVWVDPTTTLTSVRTMVYPWRVITWDISDVNKGEWVTLSQELDFLEDLDDMRIQINKADQQEGITGPQLLYIDDISFVEATLDAPQSFLYPTPTEKIINEETSDGTTDIVKIDVADILVYPIPAENTITVEAPEVMQQIRIIDMLGIILSDHVVNDRVVKLRINHLLSGRYFLQISTSKQLLVLPIQVVK